MDDVQRNKDQQLGPSSGTSLNSKVDEDHGKPDENITYTVGVEPNGKKPRISSPSNDNAPSQIRQDPPIFQCSYYLQPANENQVTVASSIPTMLPSPVVANQWQPQTQLNAGFPQAQLFQMPPHLISSNPPAIFLPQRPGYVQQGVPNGGSCHPFPQMGSLDNTWKIPAGNGLVNPSMNLGQIPGVFYQFGYPQPTFSRPVQQFPPFCVYPFHGASNYFPLPACQPACADASGKSSQKGVIQPSVKISQKHKLLWEAQSAENVQLWAVIDSLQADLADVRSRLTKFETEAQSPKLAEEQLAVHDTASASAEQTKKRGRRKKIVSSFDALPFVEPHPRPRGRSSAHSKTPPDIKEINFGRDDKNKVEFIETISPLISTSLHANGKKLTSVFTTGSKPVEASSGHPTCLNSTFPKGQSPVVPDSFEAEASVRKSQGCVKKLNEEATYAAYIETTNGIHGWPRNSAYENHVGEIMSATSQGFYSQRNVSSQVNGEVATWSKVNEINNTSGLDEEIAESGKEEDDVKRSIM